MSRLVTNILLFLLERELDRIGEKIKDKPKEYAHHSRKHRCEEYIKNLITAKNTGRIGIWR